ncbi:hypothetical protein CRE_20981 [Caenorhabditis remanei]|uniref:Uncharacterized protein n=1 Tax=Caenorhabditis remanei TaxID=31234 RepID=E3NHM2_CAERE|nr:hypothetical protein CRE_20981 [Caenorhabditis remanei]
MTPEGEASSSNAPPPVQYYNTFPPGEYDGEDGNLPPEYGPFDEVEPLIEPEQPMKIRTLVTAVGLTVLVFTLLISTVAFASLYFHLLMQNSGRLPRWPGPSISPLGKYSKAAVAADNEICSEIGRNILLKGGNAVDSAIGSLFCIGVMDTHSAGIGGGHFMTIYNAGPVGGNRRHVSRQIGISRESDGRLSPCRESCTGLRTAFEKFGSGKVEWRHLLKPTIDLLVEGYPTSHALAKALNQNEAQIRAEPTMKNFINPETGRVFQPGEQIKTRQNLLETMRLLANSSDPIREFYEGKIMENLVKEFRENGGIITAEDFKNYRSIIHASENVIYTKLKNGRAVCGAPPPSGSAVAQAILNVMDGFEYDMKSFSDIATLYHHFLESSKFSYAARSWLGDPSFVANATAIARNITSKGWADWVRSKITDETHPDDYYGGSFEAPPVDHGTTHVSIIDALGNAVSVTSTINLYLGALVSSESTGILWNNEMDDFSTPGHPNFFGFPPSPANFIRPGKRPMSSQSPLPNYTWYEPNFPKAYVKSLIDRGHLMKAVNNLTVITAAERLADGQIYANSDFRKGEESAPAGY